MEIGGVICGVVFMVIGVLLLALSVSIHNGKTADGEGVIVSLLAGATLLVFGFLMAALSANWIKPHRLF